jgi:serine protease
LDLYRVRHLRALIAANQHAAAGATSESLTGLESAGGGTFRPEHAEATLDRIVTRAHAPRLRSHRDPEKLASALATLRTYAPSALKKLVGDRDTPIEQLTTDEQASLEAIVIADGSRPSFLLDSGIASLQDPFIGTWKGTIGTIQDELARIARSIGRIQPKNGSNGRFIGTGSLIDKDKGIVLTNFHVLDDARNFGVRWEDAGDGRVKLLDHLEIDFIGEAYSFKESKFRIVEATCHAKSGRGFGHIDAVSMRIEPIDASSLIPDQVVRFSRLIPDYKKASGSDLCTIGFPAQPDMEKTADMDWNFVIRTLFDDQFGVKRLAPGRIILEPTANTQDAMRVSFGHDATTFGGASGSPMLAWKALNQPAIGLHFAGDTSVSNYALAVCMAAEELASLGVPC